MKYLVLVMVLAFSSIQPAAAAHTDIDNAEEVLAMNVQEIIDFEKELNLYIIRLRGGGGSINGRYFLRQDVRREVSQTRASLKALEETLSKEEQESNAEYQRVFSLLKDQQFLLNELNRLDNLQGAPRFASPRRAALNSVNYALLLNAFLVSMKADLDKEDLDIRGIYFQRVPLN